MRVRVRYFASLREALGAGEVVDAPPGCTAGTLRELLAARGGAHALALGRGRAVRAAVDQSMADDAAPLHDGVEVAFFPPVTGG